jgi:hypothetical protein
MRVKTGIEQGKPWRPKKNQYDDPGFFYKNDHEER